VRRADEFSERELFEWVIFAVIVAWLLIVSII
jgi:hypothetical protein